MIRIRNKNINCIFFCAILLLAAALRFFALSSVPPSPSLDEVSIGYNAYSLLQTGKDEYGYNFPLLLRAYDDWRPALYVYLVTPFVAVFGLDTFAVRLPSVLLSLLTVWVTYFLTLSLFGKTFRIRNVSISTVSVALVASLSLAISPWHIYLSRLGHEANLGLVLVVLALFFFIKSMRQEKPVFLYMSSFCFGLSLSAYQSQKIIVPVLLVGITFIYWRKLFRFGKKSLISLLILLAVSLPAVMVTLSSEGLTRFHATSAITPSHPFYAQSAEEVLRGRKEKDIVRQIIFNRRFVPARIFVGQYLSHLNPAWLFLGSEREDHKVPFMGLLYLWEAPFLLLGLCFLIFGKMDRKEKLLLLCWIASSPLAASLTTGAPHAMRSYTFLPALQIVSSLGIVGLFSWFKDRRIRLSLFLTISIMITSGLFFFVNNYFVVFPKNQSDSFQYALFNSLQYVNKNAGVYNKIVISNEKNLNQSYMFFLFASRFDPRTYQAIGGTKSGGFAQSHVIGNLEFRPVRWSKRDKGGSTLYIGNPEDFENRSIDKEFRYLNGKVGVVTVKE